MARRSFVFLVTGAMVLFICSAGSADIPHMINYQGKMTAAGGGCVNDTVQMTFTIYADSLGVSADWTETQTEVVVKEGVFSVLLGSVDSIPASVFDGSIKYLGVQVESDPEMRPLKPMVSVAYAYRAGAADGGGGGGWVDDGTVVRLESSTDSVGIGTTEPTADLHVEGNAYVSEILTVGTPVLIDGVQERVGISHLGSQEWTPDAKLEIVAEPGTDFLMLSSTEAADGDLVTVNSDGEVGIGTTNPTEKLHVSGNILVTGKATIGIGHNNTGAYAFVAGRGNAVSGDYSTVGGGWENMATDYMATIGGGEANWAIQQYSTIGGGAGNNIQEGAFSTIAGGVLNEADGDTSAICGGHRNQASGPLSAVGAGDRNVAGGRYSTVPGGRLNSALGDYSFAAGRRAKANHDGAFVWGDATDADFASTAADQFLIRASGGVGIGTNDPQADLHIDGTTLIGGVATIETGERIQGEEDGGARILGQQGNTPSMPAIGFFSANGVDDGAGGNGIYRPAANAMAFATSSQERVRIMPGGDIGIGTQDPDYDVHLSKQDDAEICVENPGPAYDKNVGFRIKSHTHAMYPEADWFLYSNFSGDLVVGDYVADTRPVLIAAAAPDNSLNIRPSGVGIGTTNPQGALDVSSTTGAFIVPRMGTAQRDSLSAVNGMIIYNTTANQFNFYENGAWVTK